MQVVVVQKVASVQVRWKGNRVTSAECAERCAGES